MLDLVIAYFVIGITLALSKYRILSSNVEKVSTKILVLIAVVLLWYPILLFFSPAEDQA